MEDVYWGETAFRECISQLAPAIIAQHRSAVESEAVSESRWWVNRGNG